MGSTHLDAFHHSWKTQNMLIMERHADELKHYRQARDREEDDARKYLVEQVEQLHETVPQDQSDAHAGKIFTAYDEKEASIKQRYDQMSRQIKEVQRREIIAHLRAYHEAIAARSFGDEVSGTQAVVDSHPSPPGTGTNLAEGTAHTASASTRASPKRARKQLRIDKSVNPLPTPTVSAAGDWECPRTVTFDDVYQNGQAEHKDTIVECPPSSGRWYIIKCEEHGVRFGQRPLQGGAKHINTPGHGHAARSHESALRLLGHLVIDCDKEKAALHNRLVDIAFANGYIPTNPGKYIKKQRGNQQHASDTQPAGDEMVEKTVMPSSTKAQEGNANHGSLGPEDQLRKVPRKLITNPKAFHIYYACWKADGLIWPVMILGWDEQESGGLKVNLDGTGLLEKAARPPRCYQLGSSDVGGATHRAIVGWAPGFEDGGQKVKQRKFPVMFFDGTLSVAWVSASSLRTFPLHHPEPPELYDHPYNAARRWIARRKGFDCWEEYEKMLSERHGDEVDGPASGGHISPAPSAEASPAEPSVDAPVSADVPDTTVQELGLIQETAGDISGDADNDDSNIEILGESKVTYVNLPKDATSGSSQSLFSLRGTCKGVPGRPQSSGTNTSSVGGRRQTGASPAPATPTISQTPPSAVSGGGLAESFKVEGTWDTNDSGVNSTTDNRTLRERQASDPQAEVSVGSCQSGGGSGDGPGGASGGTKRARCNEETVADAGIPREESFKKAKLDIQLLAGETDTKGDRLVGGVVPPDLGASHSFTPKLPVAPYEVSSYSRGSTTWSDDTLETCLRLYYEEDNARLGTVGGPLSVLIDPKEVGSFTREQLPHANGKTVIVLFSKNGSEDPTRMVFDRSNGSRVEIGKIQVRSFVLWLREKNPAIRSVEE